MGKTVFWVFSRVNLNSTISGLASQTEKSQLADSFAGFLHQVFEAFANRALGSILNMEFIALKYQA